MEISFNLQNEVPLYIGYKEDSGTGTISFSGFSPEHGGAVYLAFNGAMIPLGDMSMNIGSPLTDTAGRFPAQLVEVIDGELVRHSKRFTVIVRDSVPTGDAKEITTPALNLVYAQMKAKLDALKNIDTENLVTKETVSEAVNEAVQARLSDYCTVEATDAKIASEAKIRANSDETITAALSKKQDSGDYVTADALASKGYITETDIDGKGYQTAEQVTAAIKAALAEYEDGNTGTY